METTTKNAILIQRINERAEAFQGLAKEAREDLLKAAETDVTKAHSLVMHLGYLEAQTLVYESAISMLTYTDDTSQVAKWALGQLEWGADDQWSGRSNDFARKRFDGKREAVNSVVAMSEWLF